MLILLWYRLICIKITSNDLDFKLHKWYCQCRMTFSMLSGSFPSLARHQLMVSGHLVLSYMFTTFGTCTLLRYDLPAFAFGLLWRLSTHGSNTGPSLHGSLKILRFHINQEGTTWAPKDNQLIGARCCSSSLPFYIVQPGFRWRFEM